MSLQAEVFAGFLSHGKTCEGVSAIALRGPAEEFLSMTPVLESRGDVRVRETAPVSEVRALGSVPTVDVVIPCYRYGRYLRRCVESVVGQRDVNVRILILDDASPDDSAEIGAALAVEYPQVEFRQHVTNAGHIATYNEGLIGWSESAYCMLLSADDLLAPGALGRAVRIMERDPSIGMVYGRAIHFYDEHLLPVGRVRSAGTLYYEGSEWIRRRCYAGTNVITSPEVVVRTSVQRAVGGYRPELPHSGDLEMWLRIAAVSNISYVRAPQAFYRVHGASMQRTQFQGNLVDMVERRAAFRSFLRPYSDEPGHWQQLQQDADRALAKEALWDACRLYDHGRAEEERVQSLVQFAMNTWPQARKLPEFRALERRQRLGATICHRSQVFLIPAAFRRAVRWLQKQRWQRLGV
jgi:glycosyltransferase involved in cell wall biosynthesis